MLLVGSRALARHIDIGRDPVDWDFIATIDQINYWYKQNKGNLQFMMPVQSGKYYHARDKNGMNYEFEVAWEDTTALRILEEYSIQGVLRDEPAIAILEDLYAIKMAHRYKRNSPHFQKTRNDILLMRQRLSEMGMNPHDVLEIYQGFQQERQKESYPYAHPKLDVDKETFFTDSVPYKYDHDTIHLTQARLVDEAYPFDEPARPAYTYYMQNGAQVMTDKEKFFGCNEHIRLLGVYEESCVLALERSQIPYSLERDANLQVEAPSPRKSFLMALEKVCTSITSGWFREYAWENYDKVVDLYEKMGEDDYVNRFVANRHMLKPFREEQPFKEGM